MAKLVSHSRPKLPEWGTVRRVLGECSRQQARAEDCAVTKCSFEGETRTENLNSWKSWLKCNYLPNRFYGICAKRLFLLGMKWRYG